MRKFLAVFTIFTLLGATVSCRDDDNPQIPEVPTAQIESATGIYSATDDAKGLFKITLSGDEVDFHLQFISDPVADADLLNAEMTSETYTVANGAGKYTISPESYWTKGGEKSRIAGGTLSVQHNNEEYTIKGTLKNAENAAYEIDFKGIIDIEPVYEIEYAKQNGWYWGDDPYQFPNIGEYMSFFVQGQADSYGELTGDGYYINISFFNKMAPKAWDAKIPNQTYTASTEYEVGTFKIASKADIDAEAPYYQFASFQHIDQAKGINKEVFITGGTVQVKANGENQEVRFNLELQDGTRHVGKYTGFVRQADEYTVSSLVSDRNITDLTHGYLEYRGQSPIAGKTNKRWNMFLLSKDVTTMPDSYWSPGGTGNLLRVTLYTSSTESTDIPVGTYPIGDEVAGNAGIGQGYEVGLDFGTWFYELRSGNVANYAPIKTGTVEVSKNGAAYTVKVNGVDDRANKITAAYSGELSFVDHGDGSRFATKKAAEKKVGSHNNLYHWKKNSRKVNL